jgi:hypothetical protein
MCPKGGTRSDRRCLVKITHVKLSQLQTQNSRGKRLVTICATLDKPDEFMTITVSVPNGPDQLRVRESGVARAKDFAKQIAEPSLSFFPIQDHVILPAGEQTAGGALNSADT